MGDHEGCDVAGLVVDLVRTDGLGEERVVGVASDALENVGHLWVGGCVWCVWVRVCEGVTRK